MIFALGCMTIDAKSVTITCRPKRTHLIDQARQDADDIRCVDFVIPALRKCEFHCRQEYCCGTPCALGSRIHHRVRFAPYAISERIRSDGPKIVEEIWRLTCYGTSSARPRPLLSPVTPTTTHVSDTTVPIPRNIGNTLHDRPSEWPA
jgi:hypothetical protein